MKQVTSRVSFDINKIKLKVAKRIAETQLALDEQVVKDMSEYTPHKSGTLENTAHDNLGKGIIKNSTPYARRQYYGINFNYSTEYNSKATHHWFEKAKSVNLKSWLKLVNKVFNGL